MYNIKQHDLTNSHILFIAQFLDEINNHQNL